MEVRNKSGLASSKVEGKSQGKKEDGSIYFLRGIKNYSSGNKEEAEKDFNEAIQYDGENYLAYYNRGVFNLNERQFTKAIDDFLDSIRLNPKFPEAYYNLSCCYVYILSFRESINVLRKAIALDKELAARAIQDPDFTNINRMKEFKEITLVV
jgi:tetratricopeptide (TPR) repeat protein